MATKTILTDLNLNGGKVTGLGTPSTGSDAATKTYVDAQAVSLGKIIAITQQRIPLF